MMNASWNMALLGGLMIGLSASLLMATLGKICGLSGIFSSLISDYKTSWRWVFVLGFFCGALIIRIFDSNLVSASQYHLSTGWTVLAGLLVGIGTRIGGGCTSGHGVCGISRLSKRSIIATLLFMGSAMITVLIMR